jgi:hypothetical protein
MIDLGAPKQRVLYLEDRVSGRQLMVQVTDKLPLMGDMQIEGRLSVEVSVEFFVEAAKLMGFDLIAPPAAGTVEQEDEGDGDERRV